MLNDGDGPLELLPNTNALALPIRYISPKVLGPVPLAWPVPILTPVIFNSVVALLVMVK